MASPAICEVAVERAPMSVISRGSLRSATRANGGTSPTRFRGDPGNEDEDIIPTVRVVAVIDAREAGYSLEKEVVAGSTIPCRDAALPACEGVTSLATFNIFGFNVRLR